jgi:hypothetical protein
MEAFFDGGSTPLDGVDHRWVLEHWEREGSEMCGRNKYGKGRKVELTEDGELVAVKIRNLVRSGARACTRCLDGQ